MLTLHQFQISHYCEKVRWAMDYKGLEYRTINLIPGPHVRHALKIAKRTSTPILEHDGHVVQNSSDILTYLDKQFPEKPLTPPPESLRKESLEWERYLDEEVGVHIRRVAYGTLLNYPRIVCPMFTSHSPLRDRILLRVIFPVVRKKMRAWMKINPGTVEVSRQHLLAALARLETHLEGRDFIVGDRFTRADLTAAALLAPAFSIAGGAVDWPTPMPDSLEEDCQLIRDRLPWVKTIYAKYR